MSARNETIQVIPDIPSVEFLPIHHLREPFKRGRTAMEQLINLARSMPPGDTQGDWGSWNYHRGFGQGTLYAPFGSDGLSAVSLSCGGDIGEDDITKAGFAGAVAYWSQIRRVGRNEARYTYILIAREAGAWFEMRNHPKEPTIRQYIGYQEILDGIAQIEQLGSVSTGFYDVKGLGDENFKVRTPGAYDGSPAFLNINNLIHFLNRRKNAGLVGSSLDFLNRSDLIIS